MLPLFDKAGKKAIGSRLRLLADIITADAAKIYALYNIDMAPKWFPVFYVLSYNGPTSITEIAREIGQSHVSVSKIIREMSKAGLVAEKSDASDGRRNVQKLTSRGKALAEKIKDQYTDVQFAVEDIARQSTHDLWEAIGEWEYLLHQKTLLKRVAEAKRIRESSGITIIDFSADHALDFKQLNEAWIRQYFRMEKADHDALDDPQGYILERGGCILMAMHEGNAVGTCALIKMKDEISFELAKMAVASSMQGKGIGLLLGGAAITRARALGAKRIYLESNTILKPAIKLYEKLGFKKIAGLPSPYERSNIQMELLLEE